MFSRGDRVVCIAQRTGIQVGTTGTIAALSSGSTIVPLATDTFIIEWDDEHSRADGTLHKTIDTVSATYFARLDT